MFNRFCPPLCENNRRGGKARAGGKGPVPDFLDNVRIVMERESKQASKQLAAIATDIEAEAEIYRNFEGDSLAAMYDLLPVWCLQNRIELVGGNWWEDTDVVYAIADALRQKFPQMGFAVPLCDNFFDSVKEAMEGYERDIDSSDDEWQDKPVSELLHIVRMARAQQNNSPYGFEVDGYGNSLPAWLSSKEQLVWNIVVCALFGPLKARPFLPEARLMEQDSSERLDVITDMARSAYGSYVIMNTEHGDRPPTPASKGSPKTFAPRCSLKSRASTTSLTCWATTSCPPQAATPNSA